MTLIHRWCKQDFDQDEAWLSVKDTQISHTISQLHDKEIHVNSFAFGTMIGLNNFVEHYSTVEQNTNLSLEHKVTQIIADFEHDYKRMFVYFIVTKKKLSKAKWSASTHILHRFEINYSDIYRILINKLPTEKTINLCLYLTYPILLYRASKPKNSPNKVYISYCSKAPHTYFVRVSNFSHCSKSDIGLSGILKLQLPCEQYWDVICRIVNTCKHADCFISPLKISKSPNNYKLPHISNNNFNCLYALNCILSRTRAVPAQIYLRKQLNVVNDKLNKYVNEVPKALEMALIEINAAMERNNIVIFLNALEYLCDKYRSFEDLSCENYANLVKVRRAILTPTRVILFPAQYYFKCRFYKQFEEELALRVSLRDDNYQNLSYTLHKNKHENESDAENEEVINSLKSELLKGFKIGKRKYMALGSSTSHLRDQGLMYYADKDAKGERLTQEYIINKLGNFDEIECVAKYMARVGLVFSQAIEAIHVDKNNTEIEKDITIEDSKTKQIHKFSNGIGKISPALAKQVYKKLKLSNEPSAMQIRYAGCKGMLTVWPDMEGKKITFRKSMRKFYSDYDSLGILKISKPRLVYLNRHLISILSQLNVPDIVFFNMQKDMFKKSLQSFINEEDARDMLKESCYFHINYDTIYEFGMKMLQEPFFLSLLKTIFYKRIDKLKLKARILIPPDQGRTMLGVLDETMQLDYGQVFIQYTKDVWDEENKTLIIHTGDVLVTKNPCMHPGDVRKFQAVDIPNLRHIKDCIVFPAKGKRPHPNEMAGSDLDGDEYSVIWMDCLIFNCDNHPAMDFPESSEEKLTVRIKAEHMINFFMKFIREVEIGRIANAHLAWADIEYEGIYSDKCIKLAEKYAKSLDFGKTGINETLSKDEIVNVYPDFFDKKLEKDTYRSTKILGQLYRCSKTVQLGFKEFFESDEDNSAYQHYMFDPDLEYKGYEIYIKSAKEAYKKYKNKVESMLTQYGIKTEAELLSGSICNMHKYISKNLDLNDMELIGHRVDMLIHEMRLDFGKEFLGGKDDNNKIIFDDLYGSEHKEKVFQKASAWYRVTFDETQRNSTSGKRNEKCYLGLPWTISDVLCTIKGDLKKVAKHISRKDKFEERLIKSLENMFPNVFQNSIRSHTDVQQAVFEIMHQWISNNIVNSNKYFDFDCADDVINKFLGYIFQEISEKTVKEHEGISMTKILMIFLQRLSCLMLERQTSNTGESAVPYIWNNQLLGQLAFKIFLNLVCSRNTDCFQSVNADLKQEVEDIEAVFRLQLVDDEVAARFCRKDFEVKDLLLQLTKIKEMTYRLEPVRGNKWIAMITVKGNRYAVNHFQDLIIGDDFNSAIIGSIEVD